MKQLSDRQREIIEATDEGQKEARIDHLESLVGEFLPPKVRLEEIDPNKIESAGAEWVQIYKIDDPSSTLGNDKNFSPNQAKRLADLLPQIVKELIDPQTDGKDNDEDGETDEEGEKIVSDSVYRRWGLLAGIIKG